MSLIGKGELKAKSIILELVLFCLGGGGGGGTLSNSTWNLGTSHPARKIVLRIHKHIGTDAGCGYSQVDGLFSASRLLRP